MLKGQHPRPPIKPTKAYVEKFIAEKKPSLTRQGNFTRIEKRDTGYLLAMFDAFEKSIRPTVNTKAAINMEINPGLRYTPIQMFNNIMIYFRASLENCQPITLNGIALFNGMNKYDLWDFIKTHKKEPNYAFLEACIGFVEMYVEFMGQKKQNPAFNIFWLKNRGWSDRVEIEATAKSGALTDEEREAAQKRIATFSEERMIDMSSVRKEVNDESSNAKT